MFFRHQRKPDSGDAGADDAPVFESTEAADRPQAKPAQPSYDAGGLPLPNPTGLNRLHLVFTGRCQGVGFRYTAASIADSMNLTGWVKNHMDGSVELEVQGSATNIKRFVNRLFASYQRYRFVFQIAEARSMDPIVGESGFKVRY